KGTGEVWHSKGGSSGGKKNGPPAIKASLMARGTSDAQLIPRKPAFMKPVAWQTVFVHRDWLAHAWPKGKRVWLIYDGRRVQVKGMRGQDETAQYPELANALRGRSETFVIDGIVVGDEDEARIVALDLV